MSRRKSRECFLNNIREHSLYNCFTISGLGVPRQQIVLPNPLRIYLGFFTQSSTVFVVPDNFVSGTVAITGFEVGSTGTPTLEWNIDTHPNLVQAAWFFAPSASGHLLVCEILYL